MAVDMNGFTNFGDPGPLATLEEIHRTENLIGRGLHSTVVDCLMRVRNGGEVMPNQGVSHGDEDSIGECFLRMASRLPEWFVPVADCEGGNLLGVNATGRVFFWDHDLAADPRVQPVADSLADLDQLVRHPSSRKAFGERSCGLILTSIRPCEGYARRDRPHSTSALAWVTPPRQGAQIGRVRPGEFLPAAGCSEVAWTRGE